MSKDVVRIGNYESTLEVEYEEGDTLNGDKVKSQVLRHTGGRQSSTDGYDSLDRLSSRLRVYTYPFTCRDTYSYYADSVNNGTTNAVKKINRSINGETMAFEFEYDKDGNITRYTEGNTVHTYSYDKLGRLIGEDNNTYSYDAGGNITSKTIDGVTHTYEYDNTFKDLLVKYDGKDVGYDYWRNPTWYKGDDIVWSIGRILEYKKADGTRVTYAYDSNNVRRKKTIDGTRTVYFYEGSKLLGEKRGEDNIQYLYDTNGLTGFVYNGTPYAYIRNPFGDVIQIRDYNGNVLAKYAYDAWGNHKVLNANGSENTSPDFIGNVNPFRYRGYYYDVETKLYYLINRYYDPEVGRFISPDHIGYMAEQMEQLNGCNLYAYCLNNPVMGVDPEGTFFWMFVIAGAVIGAAIGGATAGVKAAESGASIGEIIVSTILGAVAGGAIGAAGGAMIGAAAPALGGIAATGGTAAATAGSMALAGTVAVAGSSAVIVGGALAGEASAALGNYLFARTGRSNGYWGEKWPGDHAPDHIHLKGEDGTNIRRGRDGKPLPGEPTLNTQQRKALARLWEQIIEKLFK